MNPAAGKDQSRLTEHEKIKKAREARNKDRVEFAQMLLTLSIFYLVVVLASLIQFKGGWQ